MEKNKRAFTLAEVLITLVIIGVVAAMVIPTIINNIQLEQFHSNLKKQYSVFLQAINSLQSQNGTIDTSSANSFINDLSTQLSIIQRDTWGNLTTLPSSFHYHCYKDNSGTCGDIFSIENYSHRPAFITKDGTLFMIRNGPYPNCDGGNYHVRLNPMETLPAHNDCVDFHIDLNGDKGPNQVGVDFHHFYLLKENNYYYLRPSGSQVDTNCSSAYPDVYNYSLHCTSRMLLNMTMP